MMRGTTDGNKVDSRRMQGAEDDADSSFALTIADVVQMLRRQLIFIIASIIICVIGSLLYLKRAVPIYEATASIRIDPGRAGSLGLNDLGTGQMDFSGDLIATEIAIIGSDAVAIETLYSLNDEEFLACTGYKKQGIVIMPGSTALTQNQEFLLAGFKGALNARKIEGTQLVTVSFRNPDPKVAALLANRTVAAYLHESFYSRYSSVGQVNKWLSAEMGTLRQKAEATQRELAGFEEKNEILATDAGPGGAAAATSGGNNTTMDRLRLLNSSLAQAQGERIAKEAQLRAALTGDATVLNAMFPSADLTALQGEQGRLYGQIAAMSSKYDKNWPPLMEMKADLEKVNAQVTAHTSAARNKLQQEYNASITAENLLQKQYNDQTDKAYALNRQQAQYAVLKAEVSSSRELFNTLQRKLEQAGVDAGLAAVNTLPLDTARAPLFPVEPKKRTILSFGLFLGLFVGIALAFALEATSDKIQNVDQIERTLKLPLLAVVPHFTTPNGRAVSTEMNSSGTAVPSMLTAFIKPTSRDAEAYRSLRSSVLLSSIDNPIKTLLVTSSLPSEGKSTTASNYAVVLAQSGAKVLLVDADLRRPTMHHKFGLASALVGLGNLMLGEVESEPYLHPLSQLPNLFLLPAGKPVTLPAEMLASDKFRQYVAKWRDEFDFVVIDSAPLLVVSDSHPLSTWVDAMVLVARYNMTPLKALKRVRDVLMRNNTFVSGLILNDISTGSVDYGGYKYGYDYYNN